MPDVIETIAVKSVTFIYNGNIPMKVTPGIGDDGKTTTVTATATSVPAVDDSNDPYSFQAAKNGSFVEVATLKNTTDGVITITPVDPYSSVKTLTFKIRMGDSK
ncbi:hypothetical protein B0H16DRAFT_1737972 [Mycena metata]|uniref:Uncharacterized protein n=1 Tax=Mycena metata TaxID=1033252 RepID=A0AAD7MKS4_9AGAR|nr:hypothetical protein B0H16DRAFT_1737972 [Mycena metata]